MKTKLKIIPTTLILFSFFLSSCGQEDFEADPGTLKISVLPDQSPDALKARYMPLVEYLTLKTGIAFELIIPENYENLVQRFQRGEIDIARFGGATYVKANHKQPAIPLVMRDVDAHFSSYFIVKAGSSANTISDFKDKKLSFGSKLSTSGHFMPRYFLNQQSIDPDTFFSSVLYSGAHDKTAEWVKSGKVDIGAVNSVIIDKLLKSGDLSDKDIKIIWQTPGYADYVWAGQNTLSRNIQDKIINAFIQLSSETEESRRLLSNLGAEVYFPARSEDFSALKNVIESQGLLN